MRRRNKELNIFSMSALDLFASALGAFILIAVVLFPFFPNIGSSPENVAALRAELNETKQQLDDAKSDATTLQAQLDETKQQLDDAKNDLQTSRENLAKAEQAAEDLKKQLEDSIKFTLLGIATNAKSFVILVDMSGSMQSYEDTIVRTFGEILEPLDDRHSLQVIGYQGDAALLHPWQSGMTLAPVSDANKRDANTFMQKLARRFDGGTPTWEALKVAVGYDAEAILLLSDGAPNHEYPDEIIADITKRNAGIKEIHTVAIGRYFEHPKLVWFLQSISAKNRGGFVGVAK